MSQQRKIKREAERRSDTVVVETSLGVHVECFPIIGEMDTLERNIRSQYTWPDVPERDMLVPPDAGPDWPRKAKMTEAYLETSEATEEDKAIWADYIMERDAVEAEFTAKLAESRERLIVMRGITVLDERPDEEWVQEQEWMGMVVPENPLDRKLHYFRTEVIGGPLDMLRITAGIYKAAGVDSEVLDEYENSFRDQMGRAFRNALEPDQEEAGEREEEPA